MATKVDGVLVGIGSTLEVSEMESLAKGTIIVGDGAGAPASVVVGADNTVLQADSSQAAGVAWRSDIFVNDGSGIVIGHTAKLNIGGTAQLQILGTTSSDSAETIGRWSANAPAPKLSFVKSRGATIGSSAIVNDNDIVGMFRFCPDDGTAPILAAQYSAEVDDASIAVGDVGMAFVWEQMPGGGVGGALRETMRLTAAGNLILIDGSTTNSALTLGAGEDSRIYYDGTDTFWDLRAVGTGDLMIALAGSFPSPDAGVIHIWKGDAGVVAATASGILALEGAGNTTLDFLVRDVDAAGIRVVTPAAGNQGAFLLGADAAGEWSLRAGGDITRIRFSANTMAFQQASTISTTTGNLTLSVAAGADVLIGDDATIIYVDGGTGGVGFGATPDAGSFLHLTPGEQDRSLETKVGWALHIPSDLIRSSNTDTDAIGAYVFIGRAILSGASPTYTATIAATLYIEGSPIAGSQASIGTPYSLWVDDGNVQFDGDLTVDGAITITSGSITGITDLVVADGGTGAGTFTDHGVMVGSGTGALSVTATGSSGQVLTSTGSGSDPTFQAPGHTPERRSISTAWETSARLQQAVIQAGAVSFGTFGVTVSSGGTQAGSAKVRFTGQSTQLHTIDNSLNPAVYIEASIVAAGTDAQAYWGFQDLVMDGTSITFTGRHTGIKVIRASSSDTVSATNADGTTEQATTFTWATDDIHGRFYIKKTATNATYYLAGVLKVTETLNLDVGNNTNGLSIMGNNANVATTVSWGSSNAMLSEDAGP